MTLLAPALLAPALLASLGRRIGVLWRGTPSRRRRARRGSVTAIAALSIPAMILIGGMGVDQGYLSYRHQLLQRTMQAAALAGQTYLSSYYMAGGTYSSATMATINARAQAVVNAMMPSANYGNVLVTTTSNTTSGVQIGTWSSSTKVFTPTTSSPNAVRVTGLNTAANGNAVKTLFGWLVGRSSVDMSSASVASYGNGLSNAGGFNTIILNDLSMSFSTEVSNQRAADISVLDCISNGTNGNGQVGLTGITGHSLAFNLTSISNFNSPTYSNTLAKATTPNVSTMTTWINGTLSHCGGSSMPGCSGSNLAAGLYSAVKQLLAAGIANNSANIILITDGVPNADAMTYTTADGMGQTPSSTINTKYGFTGCTSSCTDAMLWAGAQAWAAYAGSLGINVSTVYYSGDTSGSSNIASYSAKLASLVQGQGISLVAPTAASINTSFATFCSSMGSAVKLTN
jgi:Flp pilus assembly protein TadG